MEEPRAPSPLAPWFDSLGSSEASWRSDDVCGDSGDGDEEASLSIMLVLGDMDPRH